VAFDADGTEGSSFIDSSGCFWPKRYGRICGSTYSSCHNFSDTFSVKVKDSRGFYVPHAVTKLIKDDFDISDRNRGKLFVFWNHVNPPSADSVTIPGLTFDVVTVSTPQEWHCMAGGQLTRWVKPGWDGISVI